jgi:hypothetical protein
MQRLRLALQLLSVEVLLSVLLHPLVVHHPPLQMRLDQVLVVVDLERPEVVVVLLLLQRVAVRLVPLQLVLGEDLGQQQLRRRLGLEEWPHPRDSEEQLLQQLDSEEHLLLVQPGDEDSNYAVKL